MAHSTTSSAHRAPRNLRPAGFGRRAPHDSRPAAQRLLDDMTTSAAWDTVFLETTRGHIVRIVKSSQKRRHPIGERVIHNIDAPDRDRPVTFHPGAVQRTAKTGRDRCRLTKRVTSPLPHSFTTHLLQSGCDMRTVPGLLDHRSVKTTMIYTHIFDEEVESALKSFRQTPAKCA